jgi:hypothetical protein
LFFKNKGKADLPGGDLPSSLSPTLRHVADPGNLGPITTLS